MDKKIDHKSLRRRRNRRLVKISAVVISVAAAVVAVVMMLEKKIDRRDLILAMVDTGDIETTVEALGSVHPAYEEIINSPVTTRLLAVYRLSGDSVAAGMPLLELDLESEQAGYEKMLDGRRVSEQQLAQQQLQSQNTIAELRMQISVKEMDVSRKLIDVGNERRLDSLGSGTGDRVRLAETEWRTAELELRRLREQLDNERRRCEAAEQVSRLQLSSIDTDLSLMRSTLHRGKITAPHDGVLTFIVNEIGAQISAGQKVAVVSNLNSFKIKGEIAERSSERLSVGSRVNIRIGKSELPGIVSNITPQAKGGTVEFVVTPDDPRNPRLRSGIKAELYISCGFRDNVVRLPHGPYYKGPGEYDLFVADGEQTLAKRRVKLGDGNRNYVEVISGLHPGDRVAVGDMKAYENVSKLKIK